MYCCKAIHLRRLRESLPPPWTGYDRRKILKLKKRQSAIFYLSSYLKDFPKKICGRACFIMDYGITSFDERDGIFFRQRWNLWKLNFEHFQQHNLMLLLQLKKLIKTMGSCFVLFVTWVMVLKMSKIIQFFTYY